MVIFFFESHETLIDLLPCISEPVFFFFLVFVPNVLFSTVSL